MEIRLARQEDLPSINRIYNQAVKQGFCTAHLEPVHMEERKQWFFSHVPMRFPVFVVVEKKNVIGWVSLGPYRESREALAHVAEVSYYVDEHERSKGIGSMLLDHALCKASDYAYSVLIAILLDKNLGSIALLQKFGFKEWGRMPGIARIDGQNVDHLYYGRML